MVKGELPLGMGHVIEAVVEGRLGAEIVDHVVAVALADAAHHAVFGRCVPDGLGEDVAVGELALSRLFRLEEPRMLIGGVTGHEVEQDADALGVSRLKEPHQVPVGAVAGSDLFVVADVVARVHERGVIDGIEPDRVAAQLLHIVELLDNTLDVADAVAVGIVEALRIDLIEHRVVEPVWHSKITLSF